MQNNNHKKQQNEICVFSIQQKQTVANASNNHSYDRFCNKFHAERTNRDKPIAS